MRLIGRNERLAARPEILATIRKLMNRQRGRAQPAPRAATGRSSTTPRSWRSSLHGWPRLTQPQRLRSDRGALRPARSASIVAEPREHGDGRPPPRGHRSLGRGPRPHAARHQRPAGALGRARARPQLLFSALADDTPALRRLGLTLGLVQARLLEPARRAGAPQAAPGRSRRPGPRSRPCRPSSSTVARRARNPIAGPGPPGQVACRRPGAESSALAAIADARHRSRRRRCPTSALSRPRLLSFSTFRRKVNPLFYQAGEDQLRLRELPRQPYDPPHRRGRPRPEVSAANSS